MYCDTHIDFYASRGNGRFIKEKTVLVDQGDKRTVKATYVITHVVKEVGGGIFLAAVSKKNAYIQEVMLYYKDALDLVVDTSLKVNDTNFKSSGFFCREIFFSFQCVTVYA